MSNPGGGKKAPHVSIWDRDFDAPSKFVPEIPLAEATGNVGSSSKPKKTIRAHDKDENYPPIGYTQFVHEVGLKWYEAQDPAVLEKKYTRNKETGLVLLKDDLEKVISSKLYESEEYGDVDLTYFSMHQTWLENCIQTCIFNTKKLMLELRPMEPGKSESAEVVEFRSKMDWWATVAKRLSRAHTRGMSWLHNAVKIALSREAGSSVTWIHEEAKVIALTGYDREGGYGKVRKVRIEGMDIIPPTIAFAGKLSKAPTLHDARVERSVEALVCPVNHPAIIKYVAIHAATMEAYTLWWNGGHLHGLLYVDKKVVPHAEWHEIHRVKELTAQETKEVSLFRRHKAKFAWALLYVTSLVHRSGVIHNDLSPVNILFHYPPYSDEVVNIGICDWGIASRFREGTASRYGYNNQKEFDDNKKSRWWVAPELFYMYGPRNSSTNLGVMQSIHKYSVKADTFAVGKLGLAMGIEHVVDYDKDVFLSKESSLYFAMKFREMADNEVCKRPTCVEVVDLLMGHPWCLKPPEFVFRDYL